MGPETRLHRAVAPSASAKGRGGEGDGEEAESNLESSSVRLEGLPLSSPLSASRALAIALEGPQHTLARPTSARDSPATLASPSPPGAIPLDGDGYPSPDWIASFRDSVYARRGDPEQPRTPEQELQREVATVWPSKAEVRRGRARSDSVASHVMIPANETDDDDDEADAEEDEDEDELASTSSWDSEQEALEAQRQWDDSVRQLQALVNLVAVPWISRYFGRKWAYFMFERYLGLGLGRRFWLGPLARFTPQAWR